MILISHSHSFSPLAGVRGRLRGLAVPALAAALLSCGEDEPGTSKPGTESSATDQASGPASGTAGDPTTGSGNASTVPEGTSVADGEGSSVTTGTSPDPASTSEDPDPSTTGTSGPSAAESTGSDVPPVTCPSPALPAGDSMQTVQVGSSTRNYILHVPEAYDGTSPVPLIVDFHPLGGSGSSERGGSPYPAQTDPEGVIMAFPSGLSGPSGGAWNVGPCCVAEPDDVEFTRAMVAQIQESACIDPSRIYAVGFSMGGGFSHYLACHAADLFAAVAPAAFDLLEENIGDCTPSRPITVVSFRSTGDPIVPYEGGYSAVVPGMPITFLGAQSTFEAWAELNACTGAPSPAYGEGCSAYSSCAAGTEVVLCTTQGGGHDYGNAAVGWPILKEHVLP